MRRLWIAAAALLCVAACREEGKDDIVLAGEKDKTTVSDLQNPGERERRADIDAEKRQELAKSDPTRVTETEKERMERDQAQLDPPAKIEDDMGPLTSGMPAEEPSTAHASDAETRAKSYRDTGRILAMMRVVGHGEVEAAKLALQRSRSASVKDYAQKVLGDRTADLERGDALAKAEGFDLRSRNDPFVVAKEAAEAMRLDELRKTKGAGFDAVYMRDRSEDAALLGRLASYAEGHAPDDSAKTYFDGVSSNAKDEAKKVDVAMKSFGTR